MADLKICRICLRTEAKVYKLNQFQLKAYYEEVTALKIMESDNLPHYVCYECAALLHKFHKFKEKCYCGLKALKEILWKGELTYESVYKLDKKERSLHSNLEIITETERIKSYMIIEENNISSMIVKNEKPIVNSDYVGNFEESSQDANEKNNVECEENNVVPVFIDVKKDSVTETILPIKKEKRINKQMLPERDVMNYSSITHRRVRFLDANSWKKYSLSEEEALKEFRARSEDSRYMKAAYKCTDCFKGFSKAEMLNRHLQLRHSESIGSYECRVCKMRFKWDSHLRIHMRQHYTQYECLRCYFVCPLENTALLHEEYHSGVTRKCIHCDEEFRHASTYYTHLRTHRSEYVCTLCGVSFVNQTGLNQHKKVKHALLDIQESPDDDEEVDSYCKRCDIRFETRKAFEEHLFHSVMHSEGVEYQAKDETAIPRKVLGKRLKAKITEALRKKSKSVGVSKTTASNTKRRKRMRRQRRKPTTCYQCGKHFETQRACMKHHTEAHPGTSFYSNNERHICEICGASLAPGSVLVHQNMHTKEKLFSCDICGKQFYSTVGLKRHAVTHTGEKPFACSLCDKRFTQNNSMKLHYRTFHLKQPYPKRNRRKKVSEELTAENQVQSSESEESSDCIPTPDMTPLPELEPAHVGDVTLTSPGEPKQYLTLN